MFDHSRLGLEINRPIRVLYLHHNVEIPETKHSTPKEFELGTTLSCANRSIPKQNNPVVHHLNF